MSPRRRSVASLAAFSAVVVALMVPTAGPASATVEAATPGHRTTSATLGGDPAARVPVTPLARPRLFNTTVKGWPATDGTTTRTLPRGRTWLTVNLTVNGPAGRRVNLMSYRRASGGRPAQTTPARSARTSSAWRVQFTLTAGTSSSPRCYRVDVPRVNSYESLQTSVLCLRRS